MTKFQEMRQKRTESICRDYITLAPEIKAKQASAWQIVCRIAEKYEVAPNTVFSALRNMKFYGGRQNPLCQEAMDNYLNSLAQSRKKVEIAPTLRFLIGLFYFIHQFLALAEVEDILEGGEGNVMHGLTGEECLMGGHDDVGHHQEQGQLVIVNHLV